MHALVLSIISLHALPALSNPIKPVFFVSIVFCVCMQQPIHGRRMEGEGVCFKWEKTNFTIFGPVEENLDKCTVVALPWKKPFRCPWTDLDVLCEH